MIIEQYDDIIEKILLNTQCGSSFLFLFQVKLVMLDCEIIIHLAESIRSSQILFFQDDTFHKCLTLFSKKSYFLDGLIFNLGMIKQCLFREINTGEKIRDTPKAF